MSANPEPSRRPTRQELRKAIVRLRLEVQRQELRQETRQLLQPLQQAREFGAGLRQHLPGGAPLWAAGGSAVAAALLLAGGKRWRRLLRLGLLVLPLVLRARAAQAPKNAP